MQHIQVSWYERGSGLYLFGGLSEEGQPWL